VAGAIERVLKLLKTHITACMERGGFEATAPTTFR
jgi:hypothetical protein